MLINLMSTQLEKNPKCQYLFLAGEAERQWDSVQNAKISMKRLKRHGCSNYQLLSYPEAGHLLEIPWAPVGSRFWSPATSKRVYCHTDWCILGRVGEREDGTVWG